MNIEEKQLEKALLIILEGHLDAMHATELQKRILDHYKAGKRALILDVSKVALLTSSGIRTILISAKKAKELNAHFFLIHLSPHVAESLDIAGLAQYLQIYSDLETALSHLA